MTMFVMTTAESGQPRYWLPIINHLAPSFRCQLNRYLKFVPITEISVAQVLHSFRLPTALPTHSPLDSLRFARASLSRGRECYPGTDRV
jgi:hypothetical protein